jgi:hypothetical protein
VRASDRRWGSLLCRSHDCCIEQSRVWRCENDGAPRGQKGENRRSSDRGREDVWKSVAATKIARPGRPDHPPTVHLYYLFIRRGPIARNKLPREPSSSSDTRSGVDSLISRTCAAHAKAAEQLSTRPRGATCTRLYCTSRHARLRPEVPASRSLNCTVYIVHDGRSPSAAVHAECYAHPEVVHETLTFDTREVWRDRAHSKRGRTMVGA